MKVHKQKTKNRILVTLICLSVTIATIANPLKVEAAKGAPYYSNERVTDIALTKTGVVANASIIADISTEVSQLLKQALESYMGWLTNKGYTEATVQSFYDFMQECKNDTSGQMVYRLIRADILNPDIIVEMINKNKEDIDLYLDLYYLTTGKDASEEKNITLSNDLVVFIRELFNEYIDDNCDYYLLNTFSSKNVNPMWFETKEYYDKFVSYLEGIDYPIYLTGGQSSASYNYLRIDDTNTYVFSNYTVYPMLKDFGLVYEAQEASKYFYNYKIYDMQWNTYTMGSKKYSSTAQNNIKASDMEGLANSGNHYRVYSEMNIRVGDADVIAGIFTSDGRPIKVFKTLDKFKLYSVGMQPYYITDSYNTYEANDNSVTVGGDYVTGSNYQTSYSTVQNEIDNSETVNESIVNNIVNDNSQTIINNYASSVVPEGGGSDGGEDGDDGDGGGGGGILDGLGSLIGGATDIIGFLLGLVGDALSLISSLFTTLFDALKALGTMFGGFGGFLGEIFGFIPTELINFIVLAIEASVAIAIWRQFKK